MRKIIIWLSATLLLTACSSEQEKRSGPADPAASAETVKMLAGLKAATEKGIMFGHQDDLSYGIGWIYPGW